MSEAVRDIQEIFATDPLNLTKSDISAVVEYFRKSRGQFNLGDMKAGATSAAARKKQSAIAELDKALGKGLELDL